MATAFVRALGQRVAGPGPADDDRRGSSPFGSLVVGGPEPRELPLPPELALQPGDPCVTSANRLGALTELVLEIHPESGARLQLVASVRDTRGRPVPGAPLHFLVESSLFGEMVDIGESVTSAGGDARLSFTPTVAGPTRFEARFEGRDVFEASLGTATHRVVEAEPGPLAVRKCHPGGKFFGKKPANERVRGFRSPENDAFLRRAREKSCRTLVTAQGTRPTCVVRGRARPARRHRPRSYVR